MHTLTEIRVLGQEFENAISAFRTSVLTNKLVPLQERWDMFLEVEKFLPIAGYLDNFTMKDLNLDMDYRGISRYKDWDDAAYEIPEIYDEWREKVLDSGYAGFEWDW